jgi:hypothetical protein
MIKLPKKKVKNQIEKQKNLHSPSTIMCERMNSKIMHGEKLILLILYLDLDFVWKRSSNRVPPNFEKQILKSIVFFFKSFWCTEFKNNF